MNKKRVEAMIPIALEALDHRNCGIQEKKDGQFTGNVPSGFRSQISAFGAAVTMGSFKAAVAFFSKKNNADVDRGELIRTMYYVAKYQPQQPGGPVPDNDKNWKTASEIAGDVLRMTNKNELNRMKEEFINASLAIKLALNAYHLT